MPDHAPENLSAKFADLLGSRPLPELIANLRADLEVWETQGMTLPCTRIDRIVSPNCYVASPHAAIVGYAKDEAAKLPAWQRPPLKLGLAALGRLLRGLGVERALTLNNYCLSTNVLSSAFQRCDIEALTRAARRRWPTHALIVRSLNRAQHPELLRHLEEAGWLLVVSRQVYLFDDMDRALKRANAKRDFRLLDDPVFRFRVLGPDDPAEDFEAARRWYDRLYLDKYSRQNVQFTAAMLRGMAERGILRLHLLEERRAGRSVGVAGLVGEDGVMTAPVVGYDIAQAPECALYRRIIAFIMRFCHERGLYLNLSSGAPSFKRLRGARPEIEYSAVYVAHLPPLRRLGWQAIRRVSQDYYKGILQRYQL